MFLFFPWTRLEHYQKNTWSERHHVHHSHYCFAKTRLSKKDSPQESWLMVQTWISNTSCKVSDLSLGYPNKEIFKKHCFIFSLLWVSNPFPNGKGTLYNHRQSTYQLSPGRSSKRSNSSPQKNSFPSAEVVEFVTNFPIRRASAPRRSPDRLVDVQRTSLWGRPGRTTRTGRKTSMFGDVCCLPNLC